MDMNNARRVITGMKAQEDIPPLRREAVRALMEDENEGMKREGNP